VAASRSGVPLKGDPGLKLVTLADGDVVRKACTMIRESAPRCAIEEHGARARATRSRSLLPAGGFPPLPRVNPRWLDGVILYEDHGACE
jgi:hypothetical protein